MIGQGWLILKQIQEALRAGRLDDAQRLLAQPQIQGHRRHSELSQRLLEALLERGEHHLRRGDTAAAWGDLARAEQTGITDPQVISLRERLTRLGLAEAQTLLEGGQPAKALELVTRLQEKAVRRPDLDRKEEAARLWLQAEGHAERGEFPPALATLDRVAALLGQPAPALDRFRAAIEEKNRDFAPALVRLYQAAQDQRWQDVLRLTEDLLAVAPQHAEVKRLRSAAWKAIEPTTVHAPAAQGDARPAPPPPPAPAGPPDRFLLWIDGVGGYLLCLGRRVTVGQGGPDGTADVQVFADISRLHMTLDRDDEGYLLRAAAAVAVNNEEVQGRVLAPGDRITLGRSCQLLFRQDVPISPSARLELVSGHRFAQAVDAVLLMAEALVLGPSHESHICLPGTRHQLVFYRCPQGIGIRYPGAFALNGRATRDRAVLEAEATVSTDEFTLSLEPVARGSGRV